MKYIAMTIAAVVLLYLGGCNHNNVADIKANAEATWNNNGFTVVGYEGYRFGTVYTAPGGRVFYIVKKDGSDILYHGFIAKRMGEYHIYNLKAIDALSPR